MRKFDVLLLFISIASLGAIAPVSRAQIVPAATYSASASSDNSAIACREMRAARSTDTALPAPGKTQPALDLTYRRPTEKEKLHGYFFDAFGPYPIAGAAVVGAINQAIEDASGVGPGDGAVR